MNTFKMLAGGAEQAGDGEGVQWDEEGQQEQQGQEEGTWKGEGGREGNWSAAGREDRGLLKPKRYIKI